MKWINIFLCYRQQRVVVNGVISDWDPVVSGVLQGTVISLHINDITADIESEIRLFADDYCCYHEIKDKEDTLKLHYFIVRYKRIGYNLYVMQQSACLVINPITVDSYAALFNCTPVDRASDSMMAPT